MKQVVLRLLFWALLAACPAFGADVIWNNNNGRAPGGDRSWGNAANWSGGSPGANESGNALVKAWPDTSQSPVVDTAGNTAKEVYLDENGALTVAEGGSLDCEAVVSGAWANSGDIEVTGGLLKTGRLSLGENGYAGGIRIAGGTVATQVLSIKAGAGAKISVEVGGKLTAPEGDNLANIQYWVENGFIVAHDGAQEYAIKVDTETLPGQVIVTAETR
jgi:hypothetical protein